MAITGKANKYLSVTVENRRIQQYKGYDQRGSKNLFDKKKNGV